MSIFLKDIIECNSYPIVFIGSGISKRYLENFPTWSTLLEEYWQKLGEKSSIFSYMRSIKKEIKDTISDDEKDFIVNIKTASYIKQKYDDLFFDGSFSLHGLDQSTAYHEKISPFNFSLSERFKNYTIKEDMKNEIDLYKVFLSKAKVIITTNYDTLTEDLLNSINEKPTIYIGQKGFFDDTYNWSELFKIHGDVKDPSSIVITEEDYDKYDKNSILISAKILSNLINSPIIFLGYSLSDRNVQKLLSDFASQLPDGDVRKNSSRITVVEYSSGEDELIEQIVNNNLLNISYSTIKTDNYSKIYKEISKINQGLTAYEVSKYESLVKNIIITAGAKGKLDSHLVSPQNLDSLSEEIKKRRLVVALGDKKNMFVNPSIPDYVEDYFLDNASFLPEVSLPVIAGEHTTARIPFVKYVKNINYQEYDFLSTRSKRKIKRRISEMGSLQKLIDSIPKTNKKEYSTLEEILNSPGKMNKKLEFIVYNIKHLDRLKLLNFIQNNVLTEFRNNYNNSLSTSQQRRLLLAYDLLENGDLN